MALRHTAVTRAFKTRIQTPTKLRDQLTSCVAHHEDKLGDHVDRFFVSDDNRSQCRVYSAFMGGPHVYVYPPSQTLKRPWYTLLTMGASGTVMPVPRGIADPHKYARCEFMCYVPPTWQLPEALPGEDAAKSWPLDMIRDLCVYVTRYEGVWVSHDHGLPNLGAPGQPFVAGSKLTSLVTLEPLNEEPGFSPISVGGDGVDDWVQILLCVPVTAAEAQWKRDVGIEESLYHVVGDRRVNAAIPIDYVIDPARPCCVMDLGIRAQMEAQDNAAAAESEAASSSAASKKHRTEEEK